MTQKFDSADAPLPVGSYPHALRAGDFLYLSGVGPRERGKEEIPGVILDELGNIRSYDIVLQTHSVMKNVRMILENAGASWENLVDVTVFLTNMEKDFADYNEIYRSYFPENGPCRTTVGVVSLPTPIAIELKCIAYLGS